VLVADPVGTKRVGTVRVVQTSELIVNVTEETLAPSLAFDRLFTMVELLNTAAGEVCDAFDQVAVGVMTEPVDIAAPRIEFVELPASIIEELFHPRNVWRVLVDEACGVLAEAELFVAVRVDTTS